MTDAGDSERELALLMLQLRQAESMLSDAMASGDKRRMEHTMGLAADATGSVKNLLGKVGLSPGQIAAVNERIEDVVQVMDRMAERLSSADGALRP